jgi:Zinc-binding loop region of homing endonuclease
MLSADKEAANVIDLTVVGEEKRRAEEEKVECDRFCIRGRLPTIRGLVNDVDTTGIKLVPDGTRSPNVCVLSRYRDETLTALWDEVKDNHAKLETEEHRARGTSPCWIWNLVPGIATLENGYPVLSTRASLNKRVKVPYLKIHQLAAFVRTGKRTGLGKGAATMATPSGARKKEWLLVASHLCHNKRCICPDHVWPEANGWNADRGKCRQQECVCKGHIQGGKKCLLSYKE